METLFRIFHKKIFKHIFKEITQELIKQIMLAINKTTIHSNSKASIVALENHPNHKLYADHLRNK